jgi:hypothetical protein
MSVSVESLVHERFYPISMSVKGDGGGRMGERKSVVFTPETSPALSANSGFKKG